MEDQDIFELRSAKPSLLLRFIEWGVSKRQSVFPETEEAARDYFANRRLPKDELLPLKFERRFNVDRWEVADQQCITLHPKTGKSTRHILYFHGGGFVFPMFDVHWPFVAKLVEQTGASVTVPLYNVLPEASYRDLEAVADASFTQLADEYGAGNVTLMGDSAGGHMAIALAQRLAEAGGQQAGKLVLLSPWLDLSLADEAAKIVEPQDVMLSIAPLRVMGEFYADGRDPASPECSPLYASLDGLPPTVIFQGRHDLFVVDCRNFAARARDEGAPVTLYEYAGAPHVYMVLPGTREAKDTMQLIKGFLAD